MASSSHNHWSRNISFAVGNSLQQFLCREEEERKKKKRKKEKRKKERKKEKRAITRPLTLAYISDTRL